MKLVLGLVALLAFGVATTGCDVSPPAATVDGATITQSQLDAQLSDVVQNQFTGCVLELQGTDLPSSLHGAGGSTVSSQLASYELSTMILEQLITQDLARLHRSVSTSDVSAARTDLEAQLDSSIESSSSSGSPTCAADLNGGELLERLPAGFSSQQVRYLADEEQLAVAVTHLDLSASAIEHYYFVHASQFAEVCLSDIEVASQAQAQSISSTISSGASTFAAEARQNSLDTSTAQNGGAIPCVPSSEVQNATILSAIASLSSGQVSQPVQVSTSSGGTAWLLLELTGRPELPLTEVAPQIRLTLLSGKDTGLSREFDRITTRARVTVDPQYGSWSHLHGVEPPVPPPAKYLPKGSASILGS